MSHNRIALILPPAGLAHGFHQAPAREARHVVDRLVRGPGGEERSARPAACHRSRPEPGFPAPRYPAGERSRPRQPPSRRWRRRWRSDDRLGRAASPRPSVPTRTCNRLRPPDRPRSAGRRLATPARNRLGAEHCPNGPAGPRCSRCPLRISSRVNSCAAARSSILTVRTSGKLRPVLIVATCTPSSGTTGVPVTCSANGGNKSSAPAPR